MMSSPRCTASSTWPLTSGDRQTEGHRPLAQGVGEEAHDHRLRFAHGRESERPRAISHEVGRRGLA